MRTFTIWNGTEEELLTLAEVLRRNCTCATAVEDGAPRCSAHDMLLNQRTLDGLLFGRRIAQQFIVRELLAEEPASALHSASQTIPLS